jgi:hypothetical protein
LLTDRVEIFSDSLMVLDDRWDLTQYAELPEVFISSYTAGDVSPLALRARSSLQPYYMPIDRSFAVGGDTSALLDSLVVDFDAVSAALSPRTGRHPGRDSENGRRLCSGGYCYITFYNTALSPAQSAEGRRGGRAAHLCLRRQRRDEHPADAQTWRPCSAL